MYAQLKFDVNNPTTPWIADYFALPGVADKLPPKLETARKSGLDYLVKSTCTELTDANRKLLTDQVYNVIRLLPANMTQISFELYMALAHCRLDADTRAAREQRIRSVMDPHFAQHRNKEVRQHATDLQALAVLVPDAAMDTVLRSRVITTQRSALAMPEGRELFPRYFKLLDQTCRAFDWKEPRFGEALEACHFSRPPHEQQACLDLFEKARGTGLHKLLPMLLDGLAAREKDLLEADLGDAVFGLLQAWTALEQSKHDGSAMEDLVAIEVERFVTRRAARCSDIVEATVAAMERGVAFDPKSKDANIAATTACTTTQLIMDLAMSGSRLRHALAPEKTVTTTAPQAPQPDVDAIHARSVEWLTRWIEEPASDVGAPQRLNRQVIAHAVNESRERTRAAMKTPAPARRSDDDLTEKDVELVVDSGLCTYADFLLGDIGSLLTRCGQLNLQPQPLADCQNLIEPLQELARQPSPDELRARDLLHRADAAIAALERDIATTQVEGRVRQRFERALGEALNREALVYGKRHGGVIACPMGQADWPWVYQTWHGRWLNAQMLEIDGHRAPLQADQALALYVTGGSRSNYAFDISVHLWCRKQGSTGPAREEGGLYPRMNTRDWRDTRIPCLVLHVAHADS